MGLVGRGLHLNGHDLGTTGKEKVNLVVVFPTLGGPGVVKEFVPGGGEHLGNNVLVYVTQVGGQFVAQEVLIDCVLREGLVPEGKGDKEAGVACEHLVLREVFRTAEAYVGVIAVMGDVYGFGFLHLGNQFYEVFGPGLGDDAGNLVAGRVAVELGRDGSEDTCGLSCGVNLTKVFVITTFCGDKNSGLSTLLKIFSRQNHKILKIFSGRFHRILKKL